MKSGAWCDVVPLEPSEARELRRRSITECGKWDPQAGDVNVIAPLVLVLRPSCADALAADAERLAAELMDVERAIGTDARALRRLGLSGTIRRGLEPAADAPPVACARQIRFDFHPTTEGWRVSEANSDVPGGYIESSGVTGVAASMLSARTPVINGGAARTSFVPAGDPASILARAVAAVVPQGGRVALVHATAYSDDVQVMAFLAGRFREAGLEAALVAPDHVRWNEGRAAIIAPWCAGAVDVIVRFFPGEWLSNLPRCVGWRDWFFGARTPQSNPPTALISQSKRWVLAAEGLGVPLATWRRLLPETRPPTEIPRGESDAWVLKPALGRVGEDVMLPGLGPRTQERRLRLAARLRPGHWIAQRRFNSVPIDTPDGPLHVCLGVYTIDGRMAGIYARAAPRPLIDDLAIDLPVVIASPVTAAASVDMWRRSQSGVHVRLQAPDAGAGAEASALAIQLQRETPDAT
ncbi:MAG: glutathionylspermidine synthase family protein [Phycisphaeraceae bacterium]|nr:glutathionylspermidine synthase family protein [Phycisphaeraceae bacterium]